MAVFVLLSVPLSLVTSIIWLSVSLKPGFRLCFSTGVLFVILCLVVITPLGYFSCQRCLYFFSFSWFSFVFLSQRGMLGRIKPRASHVLGRYSVLSPAQPCFVCMSSTASWPNLLLWFSFNSSNPCTPITGVFDPRRDPAKHGFPDVLIQL